MMIQSANKRTSICGLYGTTSRCAHTELNCGDAYPIDNALIDGLTNERIYFNMAE